MDHDNAPDSHGSAGPGRPDPGKAVLAVNGVIAAVSATYASTHSLAVTVVAGCVGLACAALVAWKK
jgi:L-serine deaminase